VEENAFISKKMIKKQRLKIELVSAPFFKIFEVRSPILYDKGAMIRGDNISRTKRDM
jgi:hypothetical protein